MRISNVARAMSNSDQQQNEHMAALVKQAVAGAESGELMTRLDAFDFLIERGLGLESAREVILDAIEGKVLKLACRKPGDTLFLLPAGFSPAWEGKST